MQAQSKPTKEQLRSYLIDRRESKEPPPSQDEIRTLLGWKLLQPPPMDRD